MTLRVSSVEKEGIYQGSKWRKFQILCDANELASLFSRLQSFWIFRLTGISDGQPIEPVSFVREYGRWIDLLERGKVPEEADLRKLLACCWVESLDDLWLQPVTGGFLVKMARPSLLVQQHAFSYSEVDQVFRPMTLGKESVFWGIQCSFPQIYQDPKTMELKEAQESRLFKTLAQWVRDETRATPFVVEGKKVNVPMRLGKKCFSWIGHHPQLRAQNIGVAS